tara:strand:+ start:329 stop:496 length:168 start_codon:yes stop_codon:yes gene_type:complete
MYEAIEHWVQYKQEKDRKAKAYVEKCKEKIERMKELDKFLAELRKKNGQTKSIYS